MRSQMNLYVGWSNGVQISRGQDQYQFSSITNRNNDLSFPDGLAQKSILNGANPNWRTLYSVIKTIWWVDFGERIVEQKNGDLSPSSTWEHSAPLSTGALHIKVITTARHRHSNLYQQQNTAQYSIQFSKSSGLTSWGPTSLWTSFSLSKVSVRLHWTTWEMILGSIWRFFDLPWLSW